MSPRWHAWWIDELDMKSPCQHGSWIDVWAYRSYTLPCGSIVTLAVGPTATTKKGPIVGPFSVAGLCYCMFGCLTSGMARSGSAEPCFRSASTLASNVRYALQQAGHTGPS